MRGLVKATVGLVLTAILSTEPGIAFTSPLPQLLPTVDYHEFLKIEDGQTYLDLSTYLDFLEQPPKAPPQETIPPYNRPKNFGGWVRQKPGSCLATRALVLLRDAKDPDNVKFGGVRGCRVDTGEWHDPYTNEDLLDAKQIQIDHVVPLKNAYRNGAFRWTKTRRCHYANFIGFGSHLLAIKGVENMRKGDRGPEEYLPPNANYVCAYLKVWMTIKSTWELSPSSHEMDAIKQTIVHLACPKDTTRILLSELASYREQSDNPIASCIRRPDDSSRIQISSSQWGM